MYNYHVENQWGGSKAPWNEGGAWVLGYRDNQPCIAIDIESKDDGKTFDGTMQYKGEGPIGFKGTLICGCTYLVENSWGGSGGHYGGWWVIGARAGQPCVKLNVKSGDDGKTFEGTMVYKGEGAIGFRADARLKKHLKTSAQWGGTTAPWHDNGDMILSSREPQEVDFINIASKDHGKSFEGTMQYAGEGPIEVRCAWVMGNTYDVENHWGGPGNPEWHNAGQWLIGGRDTQRAVQLNVKKNAQYPLFGEMTYDGEGAIGFKSEYEG
jgi:hypothetical protein